MVTNDYSAQSGAEMSYHENWYLDKSAQNRESRRHRYILNIMLHCLLDILVTAHKYLPVTPALQTKSFHQRLSFSVLSCP